VNLFCVGWSSARGVDPARPRRALGDLVSALPFLEPAWLRSWAAPSGSGAAAAAWVAHPPELAGVEYAHATEARLALFSGWPPPGREGRRVEATYDDAARTLTVRADPLGAYPVYRSASDGVDWVSNNAELARALAGSREVDLDALAGLLGGGWPLGGQPAWAAVSRMAPGARLELSPQGEREERELGDAEVAALCGRGLDPAAAARDLVTAVCELADGARPSVVPVTGGRDSRLVLAAALAAGIAFEARTGGAPDDPDVVAARELCRAAGVEHALLGADPHGDVHSAPARMARLLGLTAAGTASLADAAGFPMGARDGRLELWHSGQGGEVARGYYRAAAAGDRDGLVAGLERAFTGRRPGRADPLSDAGRARVRAGIAGFVDRQLAAGAAPRDVPDLFYLRERMGSWAGPTHGCVEFVRDTTSPLWSARMLPHELGLPAPERERERFHLEVLRELAPELVDVPFAGAGWPRPRSPLAARAARARHLARRRAAGGRGGGAPGCEPAAIADPFARVVAGVREASGAHPDHVAWRVLDRGRVERLLAREPAALDTMSRYYVWRLATVFLDPGLAEGRAPD
jgi:hypothetical protein